jgi:hypothetical protein
MKIAIAFIGTGKYLNFLEQYYETFSDKFQPKDEGKREGASGLKTIRIVPTN